MLQIGYGVDAQPNYVTVHASLLCYWSATIRRTVYQQDKPIVTLWIDFYENRDRSIVIWRNIVQWCYTGTLQDGWNHSDATMGRKDEIEVLWNAAVSLEMYELANHCMRLVFLKYTWGVAARADPAAKCGPRDCPVEATGPYQVFRNNSKGVNLHRLLWFMEDFLFARGPLTEKASQKASRETVQSWEHLMKYDESFRDWINNFGGKAHDRQLAVLPTHFNQWRRYLFPASLMYPPDLSVWVTEHNYRVQKQGEAIELVGRWYDGEGIAGVGEWLFHQPHEFVLGI